VIYTFENWFSKIFNDWFIWILYVKTTDIRKLFEKLKMFAISMARNKLKLIK